MFVSNAATQYARSTITEGIHVIIVVLVTACVSLDKTIPKMYYKKHIPYVVPKSCKWHFQR